MHQGEVIGAKEENTEKSPYRSLPDGFFQQDRDQMQKLQAGVGPEYRTDLYSELFNSNCCL